MKLVCGRTEEILDVAESSVCVYDIVFETPLACRKGMLNATEKKLLELGLNLGPDDLRKQTLKYGPGTMKDAASLKDEL